MIIKHGVLTTMYEIYFKTDSNKISVWELPTLFKNIVSVLPYT